MEKNRFKKVRKNFFNKHTRIVTINGGEKSEKKILPETHVYRGKNDGKNRVEKVRKHVFYNHTNIVTKKWGEKNAR